MSHNHQLAPIFTRGLAFLVEIILLFIVISVFLFFAMGAIPKEKRTSQEGQTSLPDKYELLSYGDSLLDPNLWDNTIPSMVKRFPAEMALGCILLPILFFAFFDKMFGGSIGKLMFGMRVRRKDGGNVSWGGAFTRAVGKLISIFIVFLGCVIALFDKKNQALHDKMANTLVVKK